MRHMPNGESPSAGGSRWVSVAEAAAALCVTKHEVSGWIALDAISHITLPSGEPRLEICEETHSLPTVPDRGFVVVRVGELPEWIAEPAKAVLGDLQADDPIGRVVLEARQKDFDESEGLVLSLAEAGGRGGRGSFVSRSLGPADLLARIADVFQDAFLDMTSGWGQARPPCPHHPHPTQPVALRNEAWWICPQREEPLHRIGQWQPT